MSSTQIDYRGRLPYGYWYDPETGQEHLFDRGYCAIASRSVEQPWAVTIKSKRKHISCPVEVFFYEDGTSPRHNEETQARCEAILSRFVLGLDIRDFLDPKFRRSIPETGGAYLPKKLGPTRLTLKSVQDVIEGRPGSILEDLPD